LFDRPKPTAGCSASGRRREEEEEEEEEEDEDEDEEEEEEEEIKVYGWRNCGLFGGERLFPFSRFYYMIKSQKIRGKI
jgi:hypothetical protein